jgi:hypothetical protein
MAQSNYQPRLPFIDSCAPLRDARLMVGLFRLSMVSEGRNQRKPLETLKLPLENAPYQTYFFASRQFGK